MANYALLQARYEHPTNAQLDFFAREVWTGINLKCADYQGRLLDNPALILAALFPYEYGKVTVEMIEAALMALATVNWLIRYEAKGIRLLQVNHWWEGNSMQWAHPSKYPAPELCMDRIRYTYKEKTITENWNGHRNSPAQVDAAPDKPTSPPQVDAAPDSPDLRYDYDLNRNEVEEKKEITESASASSPETDQTADAAEEESVYKIFKSAGATAKQLKYLKRTPGITSADCWAMLAFVYSQNKFTKPGWIMAQNILQGDRTSADWYSKNKWTVIPIAIRKAGGLVIQSEEKEVNNLSIMVTRNSINEPITPEEQSWEYALQMAGLSHSCLSRLEGSKLVSTTDDVYMVSCVNTDQVEWLTSRLKSILENSLLGICNRSIKVQFIGEPECQSS